MEKIERHTIKVHSKGNRYHNKFMIIKTNLKSFTHKKISFPVGFYGESYKAFREEITIIWLHKKYICNNITYLYIFMGLHIFIL